MNLKHIELLSLISKLNEELKLNKLELVSSALSTYGIESINKVIPEIKYKLKSYTDFCQRENLITIGVAVIFLDYPLGRPTVLLETHLIHPTKCSDASFVKNLCAHNSHFELMVMLEYLTPEAKTLHYKFYIPLQSVSR